MLRYSPKFSTLSVLLEADLANDVSQNAEMACDVLAFDRGETVRTIDKDGRLHVSSTPISKAVVNEYYGREIPRARELGLDPDRRYRLLRDPKELEKAAPTFNNLPVMDDHIAVSADNHQPDRIVGSTGTDAAFETPYLTNSMVVWARASIDRIEADEKKEISSSYYYRADMTAGEYEGQFYDGVMRDIVGNHVAIVVAGRAGPDVAVNDSKENDDMGKIVLTRKGAVGLGALAAFVQPKLAADAKIDFTPLFKDVTAANYAGKLETQVIPGIKKLTAGKLAADAKLEGLGELLLAMDAMTPEEEKKAPAEDEEDEEKKKKAAEDKAAKDAEEKKDKEAATDKRARDKKARDKKARDKARDEFIKSKLSAEDYKAACDMDDDGADDEEDDDEKDKREARDKAKDATMVDKSAMDAAITAAVKSTETRLLSNAKALREAERAIHPYVGELSIAFDSADEVYAHALEILGVKTEGIHSSAFPTLLNMQQKPGEIRQQQKRVAKTANDSASPTSFNKMFPEALRLR